MNYVNFLGRLISANTYKGLQPWQLKKKSKSLGPFWFWSYQLNSTANQANLPHFLGKWAGLAVLFSW